MIKKHGVRSLILHFAFYIFNCNYKEDRMKKFLIIFTIFSVITAVVSCRKVNAPTTPAATATNTPDIAATQTAAALQTAGLTAQQTATAEAQETAAALAQKTADAQATQTVQAILTAGIHAQQTATARAQETATALAKLTATPTMTITATATLQIILFDDFMDGDNRTDTGSFGGYWSAYDDMPASNDNITCGDSSIWPMSQNAAVKFYGISTQTPVPTFIMSQYAAAPMETPPAGVTSGYYLRVSGNVDMSGYPYGFAGFGANLLDTNPDGSRQTMNFTALGYTRLRFWFKNGPSLSAVTTTPWKVRLADSYAINGGPCMMQDVDDYPVKDFTSTSSWQHFDVLFASNFANEGWGMTACGTRAPLTVCVPGAISYIAGGAEYMCTAAQALTAMNSLQWQTNFTGTLFGNHYDLEIAQVEIIKN
jgi:hypothetical protein